MSSVYKTLPLDLEKIDGSVTNTFQFDVSFTVTKNKSKKAILDHVSDVLQSGQRLAIMGPSGAGKTVLLRVLVNEAHGGVSEGSVTLNGNKLTPFLFKLKCGIVEQQDFHWSFLTCRETISFAAQLLLPHLTASSRKVEVDKMISKMGLDSCADTIVGNQFVHGLSGGQKRRLSIAVTLLKKLEVLFLDEPTSGLDAAAAAGIMSFISDLSQTENLITIFTIHQPSTNIYNTFDRLLLLSKGRIAYSGSAKEVGPYLTMIGHPLPPQTNPAEFLLDIVNTDFSDIREVDAILNSWEDHERSAHNQRISEIVSLTNRADPSTYGIPVSESNIISQTSVMFARNIILAVRDPIIYVGRIVTFFITAIFFAIIYIHARDRVQDQALARIWYIIWICGVPSNMGVIAVYVFNNEFFTIKKEVKNGMVGAASYLFSTSIIQIPVMFIFALSLLAVPAYGIMNLYGPHFGQMMLLYALTMYSFESIGQLLGVAISNPLLGMLQFIQLWFAAFLFCGIYLPIDQIVWPFRIFSYIMPYRYAFRSMAYEEIIGPTFAGAELCDPSTDTSCLSGGFKCSNSAGVCVGYTGSQVLDTIHQSFDGFTSTDHFSIDCAILVAIAVIAKLGFVVLMIMKCRVTSVIIPYDSNNKLTKRMLSPSHIYPVTV